MTRPDSPFFAQIPIRLIRYDSGVGCTKEGSVSLTRSRRCKVGTEGRIWCSSESREIWSDDTQVDIRKVIGMRIYRTEVDLSVDSAKILRLLMKDLR